VQALALSPAGCGRMASISHRLSRTPLRCSGYCGTLQSIFPSFVVNLFLLLLIICLQYLTFCQVPYHRPHSRLERHSPQIRKPHAALVSFNSVLSYKILTLFLNTHLNPRGFIFLITCVFMIVIGQRGTISGFALVVTLSVQALHWIASMVAPAVPIPLDLC
jgi:hypothetical protein